MLTLPPFKDSKDINEMYDLYLKIADYVPDNKISNIVLSPFKTNEKIFHEILLRLNTLNDLDSDKQFRITAAETKEQIIKRTETITNDNYRILPIQNIKDESLLNDIRDLQERNTHLHGLEELLKRENNAEIVAYKVKTNLVIGSTKKLTTKQWLIIYRLQYQIFRSQYTTPILSPLCSFSTKSFMANRFPNPVSGSEKLIFLSCLNKFLLLMEDIIKCPMI